MKTNSCLVLECLAEVKKDKNELSFIGEFGKWINILMSIKELEK